MSDDAQLLRRYTEERSEAAFAELVRRYLDLVYSAALRQVGGDSHRAEDVAQVVFTALARKAGSLAAHPVLAGWLYTATQHAAAKARRSEARRQVREQEAHAMNEALSPDAAIVDWAHLRPVLDAAMSELGDGDREAVLLRFFAQQPFAEIGQALGLSEDAARMRVERALDKLHGLLARRGVTSTAAALAAVLGNQAVLAAPAGLAATITGSALSGVAASGAAVVAAGFFMKTSTTILSVVALAAIGLTVYQVNQARRIEAMLTSLVAERDTLQSNLKRTQQRAQQSDNDLAVARNELADLRANAAKPAASTAVATRAPASLGTSSVDYVLDHPESRAAYIDSEVLRARAHFERFFKQTALSPAQQDQFLKNLKDYAEGRLDFMGAARAQGYQPGTAPANREIAQQLGRMEKQPPIDLSANMRSLLGDDGYNQFQQYTRVLPARNVVDAVASRLYDTDAPLTPAQAAQLTEIIGQNPFRDLNQTTPFQGNTMAGTFVSGAAYGGARTQMNMQGGSTLTDWHEPVTDAAVTRAAAVLTPAQLAALRQVQEQQVAQMLSAPPVHSPDIPNKGKPATGK